MQEVIGSTPIFSTKKALTLICKCFFITTQTNHNFYSNISKRSLISTYQTQREL